jgi:hypothetical protein
MTRPVPNLQAQLVNKLGFLIPPWNSFFQQLVQQAPEVAAITVGASPFSYTANANGNLIISGGTVSVIDLIRGTVTILIATSTAIPRIVPISIGDTVKVTYSVLPTLQFLGA